MNRRMLPMLFLMLLLAAAVSSAAAKRKDLKAAFDRGQVAIKFTALNDGKLVELLIMNMSGKSLPLSITKGKMSFGGVSPFSVIVLKSADFDVQPNGRAQITLPLEQTGRTYWREGSITLSNPAPKPKP